MKKATVDFSTMAIKSFLFTFAIFGNLMPKLGIGSDTLIGAELLIGDDIMKFICAEDFFI